MSIKTYREDMQIEQIESLIHETDKIENRLRLMRIDLEELKYDIAERKKQI